MCACVCACVCVCVCVCVHVSTTSSILLSICDVWNVVSCQPWSPHDGCNCPVHVHGVSVSCHDVHLVVCDLPMGAILSVVAGYHGARMYRTLKGTNWKKAAALVCFPLAVCQLFSSSPSHHPPPTNTPPTNHSHPSNHTHFLPISTTPTPRQHFSTQALYLAQASW